MLEIPFDERKCRDLITLDTLHAYYGGPVPTPAARKLNTYSRRCKFLFLSFFLYVVLIFFYLSNVHFLPFAEMEAVRQRALVRVSVAAHKKEGASSSAPKGVGKGTSKQKSDGKDDRPLKKGPGVPTVEKQSKQPSPPKPSHGAGKNPMTLAGLVIQGTECRPLMHKEHATEMIESIIKETNLDPCTEHLT